MRARALRRASSARPRSSCMRSGSPAAAFKSSSAAAMTSRYSSISLSLAASMGPAFEVDDQMILGRRATAALVDAKDAAEPVGHQLLAERGIVVLAMLGAGLFLAREAQ